MWRATSRGSRGWKGRGLLREGEPQGDNILLELEDVKDVPWQTPEGGGGGGAGVEGGRERGSVWDDGSPLLGRSANALGRSMQDASAIIA